MFKVGSILDSNNSGKFEILEVISSGKVKIRFVDTGYERFAQKHHILKGSVRDYNRTSYLGVGIADKGVDTKSKVFIVWTSMLTRCYSDRFLKTNPSYKGCTVSEHFKKFENFKKWYEFQLLSKDGWCLDKDILIKGNKVYSENTCVFVPMEINNLILNSRATRGEFPVGVHYEKSRGKFQAYIRKNGKRVHLGRYNTVEEAFYTYKRVKEAYIKDVANKWKDQIDQRVYEALMDYQVEITD